MTTFNQVTAEELAQFFYKKLAPGFGYEVPDVPWDNVPESSRDAMIAVCQEAIDKFVKPGGAVNITINQASPDIVGTAQAVRIQLESLFRSVLNA